mmetsp:Transcript_47687/g.103721  ORF Transcript_47687/g.103721 Transcript_47687/m.103721 type:complete len:239 (+) Transcript_47687:655-1371(+)
MVALSLDVSWRNSASRSVFRASPRSRSLASSLSSSSCRWRKAATPSLSASLRRLSSDNSSASTAACRVAAECCSSSKLTRSLSAATEAWAASCLARNSSAEPLSAFSSALRASCCFRSSSCRFRCSSCFSCNLSRASRSSASSAPGEAAVAATAWRCSLSSLANWVVRFLSESSAATSSFSCSWTSALGPRSDSCVLRSLARPSSSSLACFSRPLDFCRRASAFSFRAFRSFSSSART